MKVLLVEDSKFLRLSTGRALTKAGYEVVCAGDGEEALRLAREHLPALMLLDMMLPKVSGPDVLKALKQDPATAGIAVMVAPMVTVFAVKSAVTIVCTASGAVSTRVAIAGLIATVLPPCKTVTEEKPL